MNKYTEKYILGDLFEILRVGSGCSIAFEAGSNCCTFEFLQKLALKLPTFFKNVVANFFTKIKVLVKNIVRKYRDYRNLLRMLDKIC